MAWRYMTLRGKQVLARCGDDGELVTNGGRVEIRYRPKAGRRYMANARNLEPDPDTTLLPDDHCAEASAAPARRGAAAKSDGRPPPTAPSGDEVLVYADGACSGNPGPAGLGVVMLWDEERCELSEFIGRGTNNIAELMAIQRAAERVDNPERPVRIYTDSSYSIGVLSKGWKAKANQELVATVRRSLERLQDVEFVHVRGHAGVPLNERADELARAAIEARHTGGWTRC